jgi:L-serine dehydratase
MPFVTVTSTPPNPRHRPISIAEMFTIGIGPSSSHTVGPMRAAADFARTILALPDRATKVGCSLYGSLALTGIGHGTDIAILLGLAGREPETVDPEAAAALVAGFRADDALPLGRGAGEGGYQVALDGKGGIDFHPQRFEPEHPNALDLTAWFPDGTVQTLRYYSIGGGTIRRGGERPELGNVAVRHPFTSGDELLLTAEAEHISISELVRRNDTAWRTAAETDALLDGVADAMRACIDRGMVKGMLGALVDVDGSDELGDVITESSFARGDTFCSTSV